MLSLWNEFYVLYQHVFDYLDLTEQFWFAKAPKFLAHGLGAEWKFAHDSCSYLIAYSRIVNAAGK